MLKGSSANPSYYESHTVSPIDLIDAYKLDFSCGNVIKYVARHEQKNGREDLCKALWYLLHKLDCPRSWTVALTKAAEEGNWEQLRCTKGCNS